VVVNGSGFLLNDEMDDFSSKPGHLNLFGLSGGTANSIQPGKRMLSSMTPAIVEKNGALFCVLGSPGGSKIITSVFQTLLNIIDFKMDINKAVSSGRFHHQGIPDILYYETGRISPDAFITLTNLGYQIKEIHSTGRVDAILVSDGILEGAGDPRGDDSASGF
jgi:gamma-glutamyltranspeptidase / glutathione hydrolase